ncbi:MAG: putative lipid II flippase FtsW [Lachnospiraceae bacterium]|nr:putative lipid II flippase FtsW [Lachnospiraceae bacterium]
MSSETATKTNKKEKATFFFWKEGYYDYQTLFITIVLVLFGIMMVYSASSYRAVMDGDADYYYALKQAIIAVVSFGLMAFVSGVNYKHYINLAMLIMMISIAACGVVLVMGIASHGATRWLSIGGVSLQPSEFLKPAIIIYIARACTTNEEWLENFKDMFKILMLPLIGIVLVAKENLSTGIVCFGIVAVVIFIAARDIKPLLAWCVLAVLGGVLLIALEGYRGGRIEAWLDPENSENGYQTMQSLYAIGSGGLFGKGLGNSIQKTGFLPESHNDMIFSVICEELGLFGALAVIILFVMLLFRFRYIANNAPNKFAGYIVAGVMAQIAVQLIINIGVVTNTLPPTGVTLPFISYGGSSMMATLIEIGLVLSVSRQIKPYE